MIKRLKLRKQRIADFETVVSEYEAALLRYVSRLLANSDAAQDVVQDTMIALYRKWKDPMKPGPAISSWLYRVAHNKAVDYIRKESRMQQVHSEHADEHPTVHHPETEKHMQICDKAIEAKKALQSLDERDQQLVILKVYEDKSYKEISKITGISVSNVGYILHHAMKKMASRLNADEGQK